MSIDRRAFLKGAGAVAVTATMPAMVPIDFTITIVPSVLPYPHWIEEECQKALYELLLNCDPIQPRYIFGNYDAETRFIGAMMDPEYARKFSRYSGAVDESVEEAERTAAASP